MISESTKMVEMMKNLYLKRIIEFACWTTVCLMMPQILLAQSPVSSDSLKPIFSSGHHERSYKAFFSSDGKRLITGGGDKTVRIWDVEKGKELRVIESKEEIRFIDYSASTKTLATSEGAEVHLWDTISGRKTQIIKIMPPQLTIQKYTILSRGSEQTPAIIQIESSPPYSIQFSPNGETLALASYDAVIFLDLIRNQLLREVQAEEESGATISFIGFTPDSSQIVLSKNARVFIQDLNTGKQIKSFETDISNASGISPKGTFLMSGGGSDVDVSKDFWDIKTGRHTRSLKPPDQAAFRHVAFSPDETKLVVSEAWARVRILDSKNFNEIVDLGEEAKDTSSAGFSPDGKTLVTSGADGNTRFWDANSGKLIKTLGKSNRGIYSFDIDRDGKSMVMTDDDGNIRLLDLSERIEAKTLGKKPDFSPLGIFSPNGKLLAFAIDPGEKDGDYKIHIIDRESGKKIADILCGKLLFSLAFSEDGSFIAAGNKDADIQVWDTRTGKLLRTFKYSDPKLYSDNAPAIAISPDGTWLAATGTREPEIKVLNVKTGETFNFANENVFSSIKFSTDNRTLAALEDDYLPLDGVVLFDVIERRKIRKLDQDKKEIIGNAEHIFTETGHEDESTTSAPALSFSPDGKFFARSPDGNDIKIWDTATGKQVRLSALPDWLTLTDGFVMRDIKKRKILIGFVDDRLDFSDANSKKLLVSLYIYGEKDWVVSTPDGRYDASDGAFEYIHFTDGFKIVMGSDFKSKNFRKGLLQEVLGF